MEKWVTGTSAESRLKVDYFETKENKAFRGKYGQNPTYVWRMYDDGMAEPQRSSGFAAREIASQQLRRVLP